MNKLTENRSYSHLLNDIGLLLETGRKVAVQKVNEILVETYLILTLFVVRASGMSVQVSDLNPG